MDKEIVHEFEGKTKRFTVRVTDDCVYLTTGNGLLLIISVPDMSMVPHKDYDLGVYVADHAHLLLRGTHKGIPEILLKSDEFLAKLQIDETGRRRFIHQIPFIVADSKVTGYA